MEPPSLVSKARTAFHSAAAKAEKVFTDIKKSDLSTSDHPGLHYFQSLSLNILFFYPFYFNYFQFSHFDLFYLDSQALSDKSDDSPIVHRSSKVLFNIFFDIFLLGSLNFSFIAFYIEEYLNRDFNYQMLEIIDTFRP